eukprot:TRINITY_DN1422_c0_g2_i1.p3 TRINITY_DN1422_c0_g2~~TRINITY_DN1422_c0_g2_i1.p3  ORF type:complete len:260 (-),score=90.29 TRINITY_DN1422_c0_g2_i1:472-1251(-)
MAIRSWSHRNFDVNEATTPPAVSRQTRSLPNLYQPSKSQGTFWPTEDPLHGRKPFNPYAQQYSNSRYRDTPPPPKAPARLKSLTSEGSVSRRPPNYKAKYSYDMVMNILQFFNDIKADGSERAQREAYMNAIQKPAYKGLAKVTFESLLDNGCVSFRSLLRRIFPYANKQDLDSMLQLAILESTPEPEPPRPGDEVGTAIDSVLAARFGFDARINGFTLSLTELFNTISESTMSQAQLRNVMKSFDTDGSGLVRININA